MAEKDKSFTYTPDDVWKEFLRLTEGKSGIFLGETHGIPHAIDFTTAHLAELKAKGFNKFFIELDPYTAKALKGGPFCLKDLRQAHGIDGLDAYAMSNSHMDLLPIYAIPHGIEVLGHDDVTDVSRRSADKMAKNAYTAEAIDRRNRFSAQYIKASLKSGDRYIIIGGSYHSGEEGGTLPNGQKVVGLDALLGIPSMDFAYMPLEPLKWYSPLTEMAGRKIDQWLGKKPDAGPIDIKSGGDVATTVITATKVFPFNANAPLTKEAIEKGLAEARAKGECGYQPKLGNKEILDQSDIPTSPLLQGTPPAKPPAKKSTDRFV